jgi:hypothetical protein
MTIRITPRSATSHSRSPVNGSVAASPIRAVADREPLCVEAATSPFTDGVPGWASGGFCSPVLSSTTWS